MKYTMLNKQSSEDTSVSVYGLWNAVLGYAIGSAD